MLFLVKYESLKFSMKKEIETEEIIKAPAGKVWQVLTDFEQYPKWNPFIKSISGEKREGGKLRVSIKPPEGKDMTFKPVVLKFNPEKEFRWKGSLGIKGLFDGEHYFLLEEKSPESTHFIHGEKFSGILLGMMGDMFDKTQRGFTLMNVALKKECEKL